MDLFEVHLIDKRTQKLIRITHEIPANSANELQTASVDEILNRESHYYWKNGGCGSCGDDGEFMGLVDMIDNLVDQQIIELEVLSVSNLNEQADPSYTWNATFTR